MSSVVARSRSFAKVEKRDGEIDERATHFKHSTLDTCGDARELESAKRLVIMRWARVASM